MSAGHWSLTVWLWRIFPSPRFVSERSIDLLQFRLKGFRQKAFLVSLTLHGNQLGGKFCLSLGDLLPDGIVSFDVSFQICLPADAVNNIRIEGIDQFSARLLRGYGSPADGRSGSLTLVNTLLLLCLQQGVFFLITQKFRLTCLDLALELGQKLTVLGDVALRCFFYVPEEGGLRPPDAVFLQPDSEAFPACF